MNEDKSIWKRNVFITAGAVSVIGLLLGIIKCQNDQNEKLSTIEKSVVEQKQLADNIIRGQASYVQRKDLEAFAKKEDIDLNPIKEDLKSLGARIEGISAVHVYSTGYSGTSIPSTSTTPNPYPQPIDPTNPDPNGYFKNRQVYVLQEPFADKKVPIGSVGFSAWQTQPWDVTVLPREYGVVNVLGQDENGRHYVYNKFSIMVDGQKYDIKINDSKFVEEYPKSKFRWDPRLYMGVDAGAYLAEPSFAFVPNLQLSFLSYGKTKPDPNWEFLGFGVGYEAVRDRFVFVSSPVSYNIGHQLPLVNNVFVGPTISSSFSGDVAVLIGLRAGL